jgi:hypothetical protein
VEDSGMAEQFRDSRTIDVNKPTLLYHGMAGGKNGKQAHRALSFEVLRKLFEPQNIEERISNIEVVTS